MKRFFIPLVLTAVISVAMPRALPAQESARSFEALRAITQNMFDWFGTLLESTKVLAEAEDRRRLIEDLSRLSKAIFDLEQDKRFLLLELRRSRLNVPALRQAIEDSESSLAEVRKRLRRSGLSLREQFRLGGNAIERSLTELAGSRKLWLEDLRNTLDEGRQPNVTVLVERGRELVDALSQAHQRLVELLDELQKS